MRKSGITGFRAVFLVFALVSIIVLVRPSGLPAQTQSQSSQQSSQSALPDMPVVLERMVENHYLPMVVVGMGSFTFADSGLPSPFSRWFEDELRMAFSRTPHMKLFDKQVAAAMDPAILKLYGDFYGKERVDSILYGRYYLENKVVRLQLSLSDLATGGLIAETRYLIPQASIPKNVEISPSAKTVQNAAALSNLSPAAGGGVAQAEALNLSLATDRGSGATYRDGEKLTLFVTASKDAYLKLYHVDVNGVAQLIWPNRFGGSGRIAAGKAMKFPGPGDGFAFLLGKPYGTEYIKAVASTVPFTSMEADFTDLSGPAPEAISRGLSVVSTGSATSAEALAVYEILP
jgi:hypothetical protein